MENICLSLCQYNVSLLNMIIFMYFSFVVPPYFIIYSHIHQNPKNQILQAITITNFSPNNRHLTTWSGKLRRAYNIRQHCCLNILVILVALTNTVFVNSTNISTNIATIVLSSPTTPLPCTKFALASTTLKTLWELVYLEYWLVYTSFPRLILK